MYDKDWIAFCYKIPLRWWNIKNTQDVKYWEIKWSAADKSLHTTRGSVQYLCDTICLCFRHVCFIPTRSDVRDNPNWSVTSRYGSMHICINCIPFINRSMKMSLSLSYGFLSQHEIPNITYSCQWDYPWIINLFSKYLKYARL